MKFVLLSKIFWITVFWYILKDAWFWTFMNELSDILLVILDIVVWFKIVIELLTPIELIN
jgi:hypothetical protein